MYSLSNDTVQFCCISFVPGQHINNLHKSQPAPDSISVPENVPTTDRSHNPQTDDGGQTPNGVQQSRFARDRSSPVFVCEFTTSRTIALITLAEHKQRCWIRSDGQLVAVFRNLSSTQRERD